jgi:hypothetical protein
MSDGKYKVHLLCRSSARVAPTYFIVRLRTSGLVLRRVPVRFSTGVEAFFLPSPQRDKPMSPAVAQLKQLVPRRTARYAYIPHGLILFIILRLHKTREEHFQWDRGGHKGKESKQS